VERAGFVRSVEFMARRIRCGTYGGAADVISMALRHVVARVCGCGVVIDALEWSQATLLGIRRDGPAAVEVRACPACRVQVIGRWPLSSTLLSVEAG
jgi:hypothetical protein